MNDLEFRLLDELYFLCSLSSLIEAADAPKNEVVEALNALLLGGFAIQVIMCEGREEKLETPDLQAFERSYFVASKKGLLIHNSRS